MLGSVIEFRGERGAVPGYLATPAGGTGPGLLVIQEYWGLVDHIKAVADRFAAAGFVALAPDLYHGELAAGSDDAGRKMMALDIVEAGKDLECAASHLVSLDAVGPKKIAALGFCMGGQLALLAATTHTDVCAAVDFYGIHPNVKPDFSGLGGPVLCHFADDDEYVTADAARDLVSEVRAAGGNIEAHNYGAQHAFFNDTRPDVFDAGCAALAWERTLAFLRAALA